MPDTKLVIDLSKPEGHPDRRCVVPLDADEIAERAAAASAVAAMRATEETEDANEAAIRTAVADRIVNLRNAIAAIDGGTLFASLTPAEKTTLKALLRGQVHLARLVLRLLDGTE